MTICDSVRNHEIHPSERVDIFVKFADIGIFPDRGCCLDKPLSCNKKSLGICKNPAVQNNCPHPGVWSAYE